MSHPGGILVLILAFAIGWAAPSRAYDPDEFASVERMVARTYPDVDHASTAEIERLIASGERLLILDVREPGEYRVSRIPGAVRVDPGIWTRDLVAAIGPQSRGATIVLYCSVGVRSAKLAGRAQEALRVAGATRVVNLMGGIFRWHNELRSLETETGPTAEVHPYDSRWGRLIQRKNLAREAPTAASVR